ncbi:MAG: class I poly(R)-hydroxyalkanoic acid synthase [Rhodospirillales bacterium]|jgi:polyhydroxyalkanoate synthase|nr:class I poly(R)-hydroxyalkanoic acid synthase [Rhodospirillales bacterium]
MADQPGSDIPSPDPEALAQSLADITRRGQRMAAEFLARQASGGGLGMADPANIGGAFMEMTTRLMADPAKLANAQMTLWQDYLNLWESTARRMMGEAAAPAATPQKDDRRFKDAAWEEIGIFNFIKQSYLLTARWVRSTVADVEGLDETTRRKVDFYTRQFVDALSPSNFVLSNPEVLRATIESRGENLIKGIENLLDDLERGKGQLDIRMTDPDAFDVGRNVAITPGKVVFRNALMELIQYAPATKTVRQRPLLVIPPWINKYYILDLREDNSFIRWATEQGHSVFVISWVNPDAALAEKTFADYLTEGALTALDAVEKATGEKRVNAVGYCIGGTLLATMLAVMAARGDKRIASATFFATMIDFADPGELAVFIDEDQIAALEARMNEKGYLEGRDMASTFSMLRANDLIWSFVVNNYLLGKEPFPFDLLYWNSDSTRMPAAMHSFYLRKMYLENRLVEPGALEIDGVAIDLGSIEVPSYVVATREDHIAPWRSAYAPARLFGGPVRFVLSASGHIAGIINHPDAGKYCHWTKARTAKTPEAWLKGATRHDGSWWPDWDKWVKRHAGRQDVAARIPGTGPLKALADAPGTYVKARAEESPIG